MRKRLRLSGYHQSPNEKNRTKQEVFVDQIIDAIIVGGITFVSALSVVPPEASIRPALLAGVLTFLIKLKEYRGIK